MFTDEELALIDAIHADPRNDTPRLAYADWLEGQGEALHAEFIRLQCQEPYVAISNRDPDHPIQSFSFVFPHDDPTARSRLDRMLEIFPVLYLTDRYAASRGQHCYEEQYRGLPLVQVGDEDDDEMPDWALPHLGHLSRVDLAIRTDRVAELLSHQIMPRVDKLHIWPSLPRDAERDPDCTMNSHYDRFWAENIPILAECPIIDRLVELRLCGCHSTGELTEASKKNLALCREMLEPRVYVEYSY